MHYALSYPHRGFKGEFSLAIAYGCARAADKLPASVRA